MEITPRPFGDVLSEGVALLARVWRRILAPAFWAFVILGGVTIATFALTGAGDALQLVLDDPQAVNDLSDEEWVETALTLIWATSVAVILQLLATGFVNLVVHRIVASEIAGSPMGTGAATSFAFGRLLSLAVAGFLALIAIVVGLAALVVPGIVLAGYFTMITPVIALERTGPVDALRRSFTLVRGRWWPTVGFLILVGLLGSVAAQLVQLIAIPALAASGLGLGVGIGFVLLIVVQGMIVAAIAVMTTLWYVDLRARQGPLLTSNLS
jgi:hypothetical protein